MLTVERRRITIPMSLANTYYKNMSRLLRAYIEKVRKAYAEEIAPRIIQYARNQSRLNANLKLNSAQQSNFTINDQLEEIRSILSRIQADAEASIFTVAAIQNITGDFVDSIVQLTRLDFRNQVKIVLGFDPTISEPWLSSFTQAAVQENVGYIRTIATELHTQIETVVLQGARRGQAVSEIAQGISDAGQASLERGKFIARDQLGSIYGDITKQRQTRLGLKRFTWRTSHDSRVRDSHADLDGKIFTWAEGAVSGRGERIWPGTDFNCRCTAQIVEEDLLELAS